MSRITRATLPDADIGLHDGYSPAEKVAVRWRLLNVTIHGEFRALSQWVERRASEQRNNDG